MGGEIGVDSTPGEGSVFHFTIVVQRDDEASPTARPGCEELEARRRA